METDEASRSFHLGQHFEGHPNAVLEAMACGCPLIFSDIPAHRDFLDEEKATFVDPDNIAAITDAILACLENPERAREKADKAKSVAISFSVAAVADQYEKIYNQILCPKHRDIESMCGIVGICTQGESIERGCLDKMRDTMPSEVLMMPGPGARLIIWACPSPLIDHRSFPRGASTHVGSIGPIHHCLQRGNIQFPGPPRGAGKQRAQFPNPERYGGPHRSLSRLGRRLSGPPIGMFSFCLYDMGKGCLFLARDRAGEKPLFYYHMPGRFLFASELKAFMADPDFPRMLDLEGLNYYLMYGYVPGGRSILKKRS